MAIRRRKKRRTHQPVTLENEQVPRSFVFSKGLKGGPVVVELVADLKRMMEPHTASRLKARKHNRVRDFLHVAGQYNINFFMIVSTTERATYLRLARIPRGPTLQYRVHRFSLAADVAASLLRPHSPSGGEFATPPLLVLHGFSKNDKQDQLATVMFQNLFPPIDVGKLNIKTCRRIVLVHHDKTLGRTHIRQFAITATPTGMSRVLKKLLRATPNAKLGAKLSQLEDISQLLDRDGYSSESGAETDQENEAVTLPQDYKGRGARKSQQCAIKLIELGPRLELELLKIEEGVCEGNVIYHKYVTKTPKEVAELKQRAEDKRESKAARKREQEANVQRKAEAKTAAQEAKETARDAKRARRNEPVQLTGEGEGEEDDDEEEEEEVAQRAKGGGKGVKGEEDSEADDEADSESEPSDVDWYREEVGEEPEAGLFRANSGKSAGKEKPAAKREKYNPLYKNKKRNAGADKGAAPASGEGRWRGAGDRRSAGGRGSSGSPAGSKQGGHGGRG